MLAAALILGRDAEAQTPIVTPLISFTGTNGAALGANPAGALVQARDANLYGTTYGGGRNDKGTVFRITTNGAFVSLYSFTGGNDGANPQGALVQAGDGDLYGTTIKGGSGGNGSVFQITTNGTLTSLYSFAGGDDGANPYAGLALARDGNLYGTTAYGGSSDNGTVFRITTNGTLNSVHSFAGGNGGANPSAALVQASDGALYGTTAYGGAGFNTGYGIVFRITTNGTFAPLYRFTGGDDGSNPNGLMQASDGNFYGTTLYDGANGNGTVFRMTTNGTLTSLYSFSVSGTTDGANPVAVPLQARDSLLYGTSNAGGPDDQGTVFRIATNGILVSLYSFTGGSDGANPFAGLVQASDGYLYGTAANRGVWTNGIVFRMAPPPTVSITRPTDGAVFAAPAPVLINATASDASSTVTNVRFLVNDRIIGDSSAAPYSATASNLSAGAYVLSALAMNSFGLSATSAPVHVIVGLSGSNTNSVLMTNAPDLVPSHNGYLSVSTQPTNAQGQWRLVWETSWHNSGAYLNDLPTGSYELTFGPASGYVTPGNIRLQVTSGGPPASVTAQYIQTNRSDYGSLSVTIQPAAYSQFQGAQWQLSGDTSWHNSGEVVRNVLAGEHIVIFNQVSGWVTPAVRPVYVGANQENLVAATYQPAQRLAAALPSVVQFYDATTPQLGLPYAYNGQLVTDAGYGSGCVVQPQVVLTAGHLVFNDATLTYAANLYWFFEEYAGIYDPPAQTPTGWYVFDGYATSRANESSPGVESPASENLDVAALYFLQPAGRNGFSGYLVSDPNGTGNQWLQAAALKTLVGYPVGGSSEIIPGVMYATSPGNLNFKQVVDNVFSTTGIIGYPGNSGGPLCVLTNGTYYPAGVYLGGTANAIVRAIDGTVAVLITNAVFSGSFGTNHSGNAGPTGGYSGLSALQQGNYQVVLGPALAVSNGAGWQILGVNTNFSANSSVHALPAANYTVVFAPAAGFVTPHSQMLTVVANQTATITVNYAPPSFSAATLVADILNLTLTAAPSQQLALERSTNLVTWTPVATNAANGDGLVNFTDNTAANQTKAAFYRARFVP